MNTFEKIKSNEKPFDASVRIEEAVKEFEFVFAIYTDRVEVKKVDAKFSLENLIELRAFSKDKELHLIKTSGGFRGRYRLDGSAEGNDTECYDQKQLVWGQSVSCENGVSTFREDRGIDVVLPVHSEFGERAFLAVRNYLDSKTHEFTDYRLCGISVGKAGEYNA